MSQQDTIPVSKLTLGLAAGFAAMAAIIAVVLLLSQQGLDNGHGKTTDMNSERTKPVNHVTVGGEEAPVVATEHTPESAQPAAVPKDEAKAPDTQTDSAKPVTEPVAQLDGATLYMSRNCVACHGADANTPIVPSYPKLAGQNKDYTLAQMKDIKSGARNNGQTAAMKALVSTVTDADMEAIASFLASLK